MAAAGARLFVPLAISMACCCPAHMVMAAQQKARPFRNPALFHISYVAEKGMSSHQALIMCRCRRSSSACASS